VKFYVEESGSAWVRSFTDAESNIIHVSSLAQVETVSALTRRLSRRDINQTEFDEACDDLGQDFATQYRIVALTEAIIRNAVSLARSHGLRAYDAVQLAAALEIGRIISKVEATHLTVVSADADLNTAAAAEGLTVEDPNTH
jgi:predicted nucleic acid-binding protein